MIFVTVATHMDGYLKVLLEGFEEKRDQVN